MRQNPHVRICGGPGSATTLVYPTGDQYDVWRLRPSVATPQTDQRHGQCARAHPSRLRIAHRRIVDVSRPDHPIGGSVFVTVPLAGKLTETMCAWS